jgi:hypothetical protein
MINQHNGNNDTQRGAVLRLIGSMSAQFNQEKSPLAPVQLGLSASQTLLNQKKSTEMKPKWGRTGQKVSHLLP